jgi:chromosome segregation ATPase
MPDIIPSIPALVGGLIAGAASTIGALASLGKIGPERAKLKADLLHEQRESDDQIVTKLRERLAEESRLRDEAESARDTIEDELDSQVIDLVARLKEAQQSGFHLDALLEDLTKRAAMIREKIGDGKR